MALKVCGGGGGGGGGGLPLFFVWSHAYILYNFGSNIPNHVLGKNLTEL